MKAVHAIHLRTGEILHFNQGPSAQLYNSNAFVCWTWVPYSCTHDIFCSGHAALTDGSILFGGGGGESASQHNACATVYSLSGLSHGPAGTCNPSETCDYPPWVPVDWMGPGNERWYPTCTTLPDGRILAISGEGIDNAQVEEPQIYDPATDTWDTLSDADKEPANPNLAPPGHYMLFVISQGANPGGVPSLARYVNLTFPIIGGGGSP